jgi:hypothetical protein
LLGVLQLLVLFFIISSVFIIRFPTFFDYFD